MAEREKLIELIKEDLEHYPKDHVAMSIRGLEISTQVDSFLLIMQGLSLDDSVEHLDSKYFAFTLAEIPLPLAVIPNIRDLIMDENKREKFLNNILSRIQLEWEKDDRKWGVSDG